MREIAQHGITFNTLSADEVHCLFVDLGKPQYHHYYSYQISAFFRQSTKPLLSWDKIPLFSLRGEHKPFDYWKLLRTQVNKIRVIHDDDYIGKFGIDLHFYEPDNVPINFANPMKALLDGIICTYHRMPPEIDKNIITVMSNRLNVPIENFLCREKTILGEEVFVKPYRENVAWNPQDDRCLSVSMSIEYGAENRCFSGQIYPV